MSEQRNSDPAEGIAYVTINGEPIDARDRLAIDEAVKQVARLRNRLVASFEKHFDEDG